MEQKKVLIIEDERSISDIIVFNLEKEGFEVKTAYDGVSGLALAFSEDPDLILLDVMLPLMDGFEICKQIRALSEVPIIMITAKEEEIDKVLGLELGADDYITKPFGMRELIARIKANTRRTNHTLEPPSVDPDRIMEFGDFTMNFDRYEVIKDGKPLDLTMREFKLLKHLTDQETKVISREVLLQEVWGYEHYGDIRTVDVTVRRLREKLEIDPSNPRYIITKRGLGYYFTRPAAEPDQC